MLALAFVQGSLRAQTNDLTIQEQPVGGAAGVAESYAFTFSVNSAQPVAYRWYLNDSAISAATNSTLLLTNLATSDSGNYFAIATNSLGSVTSSVVYLSVVSTAPRVLWVKDVEASSSNTVTVPLVLNANGQENAVQFSLHFDTNVFASPTYDWPSNNTATIVSSNVDMGVIGFMVSRPSTEMFSPGQQVLGSVQFSLLGTNSTALDGGLLFTNGPVQILARDTNGFDMLLSAAVVPQLVVFPERPELNLQTGLFEHEVAIANPSGTTFLNLQIYVPSLGVDTASNEMTLYNAEGSASVDLFGEDLPQTAAFFTVTNLPPGGTVVVTNGFYVTDHATSPLADYYVGVGGSPGNPMPETLAPIFVTVSQAAGGEIAIEWPTRPGRRYCVSCAGSSVGAKAAESASASTNIIIGTGSPARWVEPSPKGASRFYRVIESR